MVVIGITIALVVAIIVVALVIVALAVTVALVVALVVVALAALVVALVVVFIVFVVVVALVVVVVDLVVAAALVVVIVFVVVVVPIVAVVLFFHEGFEHRLHCIHGDCICCSLRLVDIRIDVTVVFWWFINDVLLYTLVYEFLHPGSAVLCVCGGYVFCVTPGCFGEEYFWIFPALIRCHFLAPACEVSGEKAGALNGAAAVAYRLVVR